MIYKEEQRDLFSVDDEYCFAHCISRDYALGAGIAVEFNKRFDMKKRLKALPKTDAVCIRIDRVYNLVTKRFCFQKPTLESMKKALCELHDAVIADKVSKLAMPKIGCGLDRLDWKDVESLIKTVFNDVDIEILVCYL